MVIRTAWQQWHKGEKEILFKEFITFSLKFQDPTLHFIQMLKRERKLQDCQELNTRFDQGNN